MRDAEHREAALRRLLRDAREASEPELDWSRIEARVLRQAANAPGTPSARAYAWGALAVAARLRNRHMETEAQMLERTRMEKMPTVLGQEFDALDDLLSGI